MITIERAYRLLDSGLSLVTVNNEKKATIQWSIYQTKQITKDELKKNYDKPSTSNIALICGFADVEILDVDLKVFQTLKEQSDFWDEFYQCVRDNIDDFDLKFAVYKTINQGYHIIYKCTEIQGNQKLAVLKGHERAVIETRGRGGYAIVYDNQIGKLDYSELNYISTRDREILINIARSYHYIEPEQVPQPKPKNQPRTWADEVTPWTDYNQRVSIFDVIGDQFRIVDNLSKHYTILRNGGESSHSGYVYKDSGCMYLFSTGTIYPHEQLISPFKAYAYKYHRGNMSQAAKDLYQQGYGSRLKPKVQPTISEPLPTPGAFPIEIFPQGIQEYMIACNKTLGSSIDYMGCAMIWMVSVIVGNSIHVKAKSNWIDSAVLWLAIVGKAGVGKTPSIKNIIKPLTHRNGKIIKAYYQALDKYNEYCKLSDQDKKQREQVNKPRKEQFIANDITLEALVDLHQENPHGIGVFKDELNGWFKDMNKYRAGSDLEFWLSTWSGQPAHLNRLTRPGSFVEMPFISVLGGIQPSILSTFYSNENKENGFVDRMLLTYPETEVQYYNDEELSSDLEAWYNGTILAFFDQMRNRYTDYTPEGDIAPMRAFFDSEAAQEWKSIFNSIVDIERGDHETEYIKAMLPKQKSYIPRFALLIHLLNSFVEGRKDTNMLVIGRESVKKAHLLSQYFIEMAKKVRFDGENEAKMKDLVSNYKSPQLALKKALEEMPNSTNSALAAAFGVSKRTIMRWKEEIKGG